MSDNYGSVKSGKLKLKGEKKHKKHKKSKKRDGSEERVESSSKVRIFSICTKYVSKVRKKFCIS